MQNKYFFLPIQNEDLNKLAEEARAVKDEIEILRYTSDKVVRILFI